MSRLNDGLYSSNNQQWETRADVINALLNFEGRSHFDLDVACSRPNVPALAYYTETGFFKSYQLSELGTRQVLPENRENGLTGSWGDADNLLCWMNPPYGKALEKFMKKAMEESKKGARVWALVPARTETIYQHDYGITQAGFTVMIKGRLKFDPSPEYRPALLRERFVKAIRKQNDDYAKHCIKPLHWITVGKKVVKEANNGTAPFPTMLLYYGDDAEEKAARWVQNPPLRGTLMTVFKGAA